ncbi:branched-chain amino acid transport system ATP-binding protein [Micromonospora pattaloongensis]|uniref:Branched-chain amino acid transport system ATP-binding protein n=1 Tax=Micromonospora pattaloongensis TaxID=405436 RepID=A0A1H3RX96_9ACTN|nr:ATP-binding cassette domain-containing protein [Micromonospora pattaloongensis]SDZ30364.1 branched-chain amino acid transport system ATP-binding protein [Micromonospora pattaloongensis]
MSRTATHNTVAPAVRTEGLTVRYGAFQALSDVTVSLPAGQISGLIGPNGAGKTTLLNAISGFTSIAEGSVHVGHADLTALDARRRALAGVVRGFQTVRLLDRESVLTNVLIGTERLPQPSALAQFFGLPSQWRAGRRDTAAAAEVLDLLGLTGQAHRRVDELPFASRRLVEVARVLVSSPSVILLDEPAAGLDQEGRQELAAVLTRVHHNHPSTMVVVEHDVDLVKSLCSYVIALDSGAFLRDGTPAEVFGDRQVQLAYFGRAAGADA